MLYWILMFVLAAGCVGMLAVSFGSIKKNRAAVSAGDRNGRSRSAEKMDEGYDDAPKRSRRQAVPAAVQEKQHRVKKKKRQWKILLEDIDSWEKYSFTFYDSVGIGRSKDGSMYEKFLPVSGDGRVSKMHCVIIRRGDRLYLKDEGSRNGTYLNGERIERPVVIQRDDIIGLGETRLEVQKILRESPEV